MTHKPKVLYSGRDLAVAGKSRWSNGVPGPPPTMFSPAIWVEGGQRLVRGERVRRNAMCPCNSGKKFKLCCKRRKVDGLGSYV